MMETYIYIYCKQIHWEPNIRFLHKIHALDFNKQPDFEHSSIWKQDHGNCAFEYELLFPFINKGYIYIWHHSKLLQYYQPV
jgi:hypothetical protein